MTYATSFLHKPTNCLLHFWTFFHYQEKLTQLTENKKKTNKKNKKSKKNIYIYKTNNLKKKTKPSCAKKQFIYIYQEAKLIDVSLENNI